MATPSTHNLSWSDAIGLTLSTTVSFFSLTCVFVMFLIMSYNIYRERRANPLKWRLIKEPIDLYILLLFLCDLVQSLGFLLNIKWLHTGVVVEGAYCTTQGGILQFGAAGSAMITLVIAIHSFVTVWWRKGVHNLFVAKIVMAIVWLYVFLFVVGGISANANKAYITPDPFWCWISPNYIPEQLFGEYIWHWLTLFFSFLAYIPLYFCSRGNIIVSDKVWWKFSFRRVQSPDSGYYRALGLLAYPIVNSMLVLPVSIARWRGFNDVLHGASKPFSPAFTLTAKAIFELTGAFDVLLLLTTRPDVLLFGKHSSSTGHMDRSTSYGMAPAAIQAAGHEQGRLPDSSMHVQTCPHCKMSFLDGEPTPPPPKEPFPPHSSHQIVAEV